MVTMCGIYDIYGGHIQTLFYYSKGGGGERVGVMKIIFLVKVLGGC